MNDAISYDFIAPRRIVFGWGRRRELGEVAKTLGRRAFLVIGLPNHVADHLVSEISAILLAEGVEIVPLATLMHEPEVSHVDQTADQLRQFQPGDGDFILAIGGGAAIDLAKATAAMAVIPHGETVRDFLEGVGKNLKIEKSPLPVLAMPTTAGTGAEATKNAVISSYDPPFKKSLRDDRLMPAVALVDPELTATLPPSVTAACGMDAITQLIESCVSRRRRPIPSALAEEGLKKAIPAIVVAVEDGANRPAREAMAHAALLSGMALANSGLGMAHGVAAALGTHARVPHGAACALMLPVSIRANMDVCREEYSRLAKMLFGHSDLLIEIERLCDRLPVPRRLADVGVAPQQIPAIVRDSRGASMSGNPRELSDDELTKILEGVL